MEDSPVWKDEKHLHYVGDPNPSFTCATDLQKIIKECAQFDGRLAGGGKGGEKKTPNISWMLKSRLQKLVNRSDDEYVSSHIPIGRHVKVGLVLHSFRFDFF